VGKGNNGADARAASGFLDGRTVEVLEVTAPATELPRLHELLEKDFTLIIDGLFGIGLNRPLDEDWQKFVAAVNASKIPVLAIDVPSGLNCETGEPMGAAIEANYTLTVGAPKTGMLAAAAWPYVGRLEVLDHVGLAECPVKSELNWPLPDDFKDFPPTREVAGHKGTFGHLAIVAGSLGFHGASVLTTRAAQRAQPGLITLFTQPGIYHPVAAQLQAPMVNLWMSDAKIFDDASALLVGPGLASPDLPEEMKSIFRRLWRDFPHPIVADASALDWIAAQSLPKNLVRVVTPHPGEAARMINTTAQKIQANRVQSLREISRRYGNCWVVLKGHQTLIGRSEGDVYINSSGNPHLAQGGSGDVLSGLIAGFLAQPALQSDPGQAIRYAVWRHGLAADELQSRGGNWIVEDVVEELGEPL
jgi:NAD(P)H-hydrate epimerase